MSTHRNENTKALRHDRMVAKILLDINICTLVQPRLATVLAHKQQEIRDPSPIKPNQPNPLARIHHAVMGHSGTRHVQT